ncbi:MAG: LysM peptidoglycan-binding domain-containing protein [Chromatiales bacterium]|nr:LysM peptidoglycan-binding domain-containing protein [Chromatiales bacterium]
MRKLMTAGALALASFVAVSPAQAFMVTSAQADDYIVVAPGDTLGKLAGNRWRAMCELNALANCNVISIGQVLALPPNR